MLRMTPRLLSCRASWPRLGPWRLRHAAFGISQRNITRPSMVRAEAASAHDQVLSQPPVAFYSDEMEDPYWKKIPRWKDVPVARFLSHKWQVRHVAPLCEFSRNASS